MEKITDVITIIIFSLCIFSSFSASGQTADDILVLEGATLISPERNGPLTDSLVVVRGNRIESVGQLGSTRYPSDAQVLNLRQISYSGLDRYAHSLQELVT